MKPFRRGVAAVTAALAAVVARVLALEQNGVTLPIRLSAKPPTTYSMFTIAGASIGLSGPLDAHYRALKAVSFRVLAGATYWPVGNVVQVLDAGKNVIASGAWFQNLDQQAELPVLLALDNPVVLAAGADFYLRTLVNPTVVDSNRGAGTTSTDGSIRFLDSATMTLPALNFLSGPLLPKQTIQPLDPADFPVVTSAAQLLGAGVALLIDNVRGPRLIRRAAGGALSYGAPLSATDGDSGTPRLSASSTLTPVLRSPIVPGTAPLNALNLYRVFTPAADTVLVGLRDRTAHTGPVRAYVWESGIVGQPRAVGSKATPNGAATYESRFDSPITLSAGERYLIGWAAESGQVLSGTDSPALAYQGFDVSIRSQYSGSFTTYPDNLLGNNQFPTTFDLLTATAVQPKGVLGPSDPLDFPTATDPVQLAAGGLALLDDGVAAPRLVRKRTDGSVWLGAVFAPPALGFKVYRLSITAGGDGNYSAVSELQLRSAAGGASVAQGGVASDNSRLSGDYPGSNAFDNDATSSWISAGLPSAGGPKILTYTFPNAVKLVEYAISVYVGARGPHAWTFEGSPDGAAWTVLDTQTGQVFADGTMRAFPVANG